MPAMFVANCTKQELDFQYVLPGKKLRKQPIGVGRQIRLSGDLSVADIEAVVQQHAKYGMVAVSEIPRTRAFVGYCFNTERPVPMDSVRKALEINSGVLDVKGREIREAAAVAVHNQAEDAIEQFQPVRLVEMEASIEEMSPKDQKGAQEHQQVHEITRISRTSTPQKSTRGAGAQKPRRQRRTG